MHPFEWCKKALANGEFIEALKHLEENPDLNTEPDFGFYHAMARQSQDTSEWEGLFDVLIINTPEKLYSCQQIIKLHRQSNNHLAEREWLQRGIETASAMGQRQIAIEMEAAFANRLLADGLTVQGKKKAQSTMRKAIEIGHDNLTVAMGTLWPR